MAAKFIYGLIDPRDGNVRYVGASADPEGRFRIYLAQTDPPSRQMRDWLDDLESNRLKPELRLFTGLTEDWGRIERQFQKVFADYLFDRMTSTRSASARKKQQDKRNRDAMRTYSPTPEEAQRSLETMVGTARSLSEAKARAKELAGSVGSDIRDWRRTNNITQTALAREADIPTAYLSMVESGKRFPSANFTGRVVEAMERMGGIHASKGAREDVRKARDK